jgi:hypothetical protein
MSRQISDFNGTVIAPSVTNPYGLLKDDPNGTVADVTCINDAQVFFQRLMEQAGVVPNGLEDDSVNGFQLYEALMKTPFFTPGVESRVTLNGDTIGFSKTRFIQYVTIAIANTVTIDTTGVLPGMRIVIVGNILNGTTFTFTGSGPFPISFVANPGSLTASAARRRIVLEVVAIDTANVLGSGANSVMTLISGLNDA